MHSTVSETGCILYNLHVIDPVGKAGGFPPIQGKDTFIMKEGVLYILWFLPHMLAKVKV